MAVALTPRGKASSTSTSAFLRRQALVMGPAGVGTVQPPVSPTNTGENYTRFHCGAAWRTPPMICMR